MFIKISAVLVLACLSSPVLSYEIGDVISPEIAKKLSLQEGKPAVLDFFASWCVSCAKEIPEIKDFIKKHADANVEVIGVDVDEVLEEGVAFQKQLAIDFTVVNDTDQEIVEAFSPIGMPALYYVIDGKVVGKRIGAINKIDEQIKEDLESFGVKL